MPHSSSKMQDLSVISTVKMGGLAKFFFAPKNREDSILICDSLRSKSLQYIVIGNLSNSLFRSGTISTAIISTKYLTQFIISNNILTCQPGVQLPAIAKYLSSIGLPNFNPLAGIPSTMGGAVVNNAGSYGTSIADLLTSIELIDSEGNILLLSASHLNYSWRSSLLKLMRFNFMVLSCSFNLDYLPSSPNRVLVDLALKHLTSHLAMRHAEQRSNSPNLGSTFATEDLAILLVEKKKFFKLFILFIRKLIYLSPLSKKFKAYLVNIFNKYFIWFLSGFESGLLPRLSLHNSNVFLKVNSSDSPESYFVAMQLFSSINKSLNPEINLYLDVK